MAEYELHEEELDVQEGGSCELECSMTQFGALGSSDETMATLGDRWPYAAKQDGD